MTFLSAAKYTWQLTAIKCKGKDSSYFLGTCSPMQTTFSSSWCKCCVVDLCSALISRDPWACSSTSVICIEHVLFCVCGLAYTWFVPIQFESRPFATMDWPHSILCRPLLPRPLGSELFQVWIIQDLTGWFVSPWSEEQNGYKIKEPESERTSPHFGFPGGTSGKESACQCRRRRVDPWVRKIPWRRNGNPLQYPWTQEPGGLQPTGLQRIDLACTRTLSF